MPAADEQRPRIFLTGATGYIGARLAPHLLERGYRVRCFCRDSRKLESRPWARHPAVEIVEGDIADTEALAHSMEACGVAYYLVHSMMAAGGNYAQRDRELARSFATAAAESGVDRIIYLGGLGETGDDLSPHLASRREVERALADGPVPVTILRAAMIIGSGSASFEILRYLVERLPIMLTPRWVRTECQPIAVRDVLRYLVECLDVDETIGRTIDIGGPEVRSYREIMDITAEALGLRRRFVIPVPVLTPRLSSLWIHLVTPLSSKIARPLAEGLRNRVVCRNDLAERLMPGERLGIRESIVRAMGRVNEGCVESSWSDAGVMPGDPEWAGGRTFVDRRERIVRATPESLFRAVCGIGGRHGYGSADWLWRVRGAIDRIVAGPGLRRGRRHPDDLAYGDAIDFWRVTRFDPPRHLELRAEMKLPGVATLSFDIEPIEGDPCSARLVQTARFKPRGLAGLVYWYAVKPLHGMVFRGMVEGLAQDAADE